MKYKVVRIILTVILSLPTAFFLLFMFGEVLSGDLSGFSHLLQAAPLMLLIWAVWGFPRGKK